ncbi:MAG: hypothetical protein GY810_06785 [Aureispira sp.]|nr:hypothetical protein [Aureispira sp.]
MPQQSVQIIEFSAPLCSACQEVAETIATVLQEPNYQDKVGFKKVNGLESISLLTQYGLADGQDLLDSTAFPITIFLKDSQEVKRELDTFSAGDLRSTLDQLLGQVGSGGSAFAGRTFSGGIIIRTFYDEAETDEDFQSTKQVIKALMGEPEVFRRIHFEWQSKKALFARRYELDKHPKGPVSLFFDKNGAEHGRLEGILSAETAKQAIIATFERSSMDNINTSSSTVNTTTSTPKPSYAQQPQRKLRLIEFYRDNCTSCKAIAPTIAAAESKYKDWVSVHRIHGEQNPDFMQKYKRKATEDLIFFPMVFIETEEGQLLYNSDHYKNIQKDLDLKLRHFLFLETV